MIKWLSVNNWRYFFILCGISLLFVFLINSSLFTDSLYYSTLKEQYTIKQIQGLLYLSKSWKNISYFFIPIIIIVRILYTSFCLYIGSLVEESHWKFKALFNISLKADIAFCLSPICNFYYYLLSDDYKTVEDLGVNCFSLLKIVDNESIPNWLISAYNSINLFELLYIIFLVVFLKISFQLTYLKSTIFVLLTYFIGNYLYVVGMTFLYLNFS